MFEIFEKEADLAERNEKKIDSNFQIRNVRWSLSWCFHIWTYKKVVG